MSSTITSLITLIIVGAIGYYVWINKDSILGMIKSGGGSTSSIPMTITSQPILQSTTASSGGCNPNLLKAMLHPNDKGMQLQFGPCITVTGTVVGQTEPHYAPDGDMVFALKLDPQYSQYVNSKNNAAKYQGGIWCEAECQVKNTSKDPWHQGDCSVGGPFPKFRLPKRGDRLKVTGLHTIDNGEGGHAEIHPVSNIEFLSPTTTTTKAHLAYIGNLSI